ncbi:DUF4942 domain-containing protein [Escherichia coli]|nr:DUF4942 domain-containing protein [Escherichia coli]EKQ8157640.1 DUF4942 domain-containing protein [Escherichia coli]ELC3366856.1 DUF4942 domain-containing protein [Escherichia coli]MBA1676057.1 DUF4942 domain-containing protein [Escherichia coli]
MPAITGTANERHVFLNAVNDSLLSGVAAHAPCKGRYEDEMFIIKYFKKGSAHITFKRLELIDRINDIIARHFPSVLSA